MVLCIRERGIGINSIVWKEELYFGGKSCYGQLQLLKQYFRRELLYIMTLTIEWRIYRRIEEQKQREAEISDGERELEGY